MTNKVVRLTPRANAQPDIKRQFAWLRQVQQDPAILSSGFELAFLILQHINNNTGLAWPTQETLAHALGVSKRTVRSLSDALYANGHIAVQHGHGRNTPNKYRLVWKRSAEVDNEEDMRNQASAYGSEKEETDFPLNDANAEAHFPFDEPKCGNPLHEMGKSIARNAEADCLQNFPHELPSITNAVPAADAAQTKIKKAPTPKSSQSEKTPEADLYRRGKEILGQSAGGLIKNLVKAKRGNIALARAALETASTAENPREYIGGIINGGHSRGSPEDLRARGEAW